MGDFTLALRSHQHALDIRLKLFGEDHASTADCHCSMGNTQCEVNDDTSALQSHHIRRKRFGEVHAETAVSLYSLGITQMKMGDITSDLQSHRHKLISV